MKIVMLGAGSMGSSFGMKLHLAGNEVALVDEYPAHVEAIKKDGLYATLNNEVINASIPAFYPHEAGAVLKDAELVILLSKATQLDDLLSKAAPFFGAHANVLCILNGLGHDRVVLKHVEKENFYLGNTLWSAGFIAPGKVKLNPGGGNIYLKHMGSEDKKPVAEKIAKVLHDAKLEGYYTDELMRSIYKKLCANATMNGLCTILDGNMNQVATTPTGKSMIHHIVSEIIAVAAHEGIDLDYDETIANIEWATSMEGLGIHYPSMHQDLITNNRLTEVQTINGIIAQKGEEYGIPTPYNAFLTELILAKEVMLEAK